MFDSNLKNAITFSVMKFVDEYDGDIIARYTKRGFWLDTQFLVGIKADNPVTLLCDSMGINKRMGFYLDRKKRVKLKFGKGDEVICNLCYLVEDDDFEADFLRTVEQIKSAASEI